MFKILSLLLSIEIIFCVEENVFIEFTSKIIKKTLGRNYCLSYLTQEGYDLHLVQEAVNKIDVLLMRITFDYNGDMMCNSYIIISNNYRDIKDIFLLNIRYKLGFKAGSRVLIFRTRKQRKLKKYFQLNKNIYGCDIFVIEGYPRYFNEGTRYNLRMVSIRNESSINLWDTNKNPAFHGENDDELQTREWTVHLLNQTFRASMFDCPPYISYDPYTRRFEGVEADILRELLKNYPFEYKVYYPNNSTSNIYDVMIDDVAKRYSNLVMCSPWLDGRCTNKVDISFIYTQQCITFFVSRTHKLERKSFIFTPISLHLGLGVLISAILVVIAYLRITTYQEKLLLNTHHFKNVTEISFELLRILTLRQAAKSFLTIHNITRLIVVSWILFSLIIATIYSSGISTSMTYPPFTGGIHSFEDIADQNVEWGGIRFDNKAIFSEHLNPIFEEIARLYSKDLSNKVINERLRDGKNVAIIVKMLTNNYIYSDDLEELDDVNLGKLKMLPKCAALYLVGFYLAKNSPITIFINKYLSRYFEHGIINYWYIKLNNKVGVLKRLAIFHSTGAKELGPTQIVLQIEELQGLFILLICGWCVGALALICEILYLKYKNAQKD